MNPKKHPVYDPVILSKEMPTKMAEAFRRYDDRKGRAQQRMTLNEAAAQFGITSLKVRKILITAGVYSTAVSREVQDLYRRGRSVAEIGRMLNLSRAFDRILRLQDITGNPDQLRQGWTKWNLSPCDFTAFPIY